MNSSAKKQEIIKTRGRLLHFHASKKGNGDYSDEPVSKFGKGLIDSEMKRLKQRFSRPTSEAEWRDKAAFLLMSSTGLRAREIVNLKFSCRVQINSGNIGFEYRRKGGKPYVAIPSREALRTIAEYHRRFGIESDFLLNTLPSNVDSRRHQMTTRTLQRIIDNWKARRADGKKASPHSFRHTVGQRAFIKAGSIAAQKILGHSSPIITSKFYTLPYFDGSKILKW